MPTKLTREVLAAKRLLARTLAAEPGVVGVGVEADGRGRAVLLVLVEPGGGGGAVPAEFRGIPVAVRISSSARKR